jgi:hypothetical protein
MVSSSSEILETVAKDLTGFENLAGLVETT